MRTSRRDNLAKEVYQWVFHFLDVEPFFTGMEAERIATACEEAFKKAWNDDDPEEQHHANGIQRSPQECV